MQRGDNGLRSVGANLGQDGVEADTVAAELPEWIVDPGRPVEACDDLAAWCSSGVKPVLVDAEGELDDAWDAVVFPKPVIVGNRFRIPARRYHHAVEARLTD